MHHRKRRPGKTATFTKRWKVNDISRDARLRPSEARKLAISPRKD